MQMVNEIGRNVMGGGSRRAALWAGLHWHHPDVFEFISLKDWPEYITAQKAVDFNTPAPMDMTNISVILDDDFFRALDDPNWTGLYQDGESDRVYTRDQAWAEKVYWAVIEKMLTTGEPGFSVDTGENTGENLRNPCTEITSSDDNDVCNLGSINLARVESKEEFAELVDLGTAFLLCGTLVSEVPFEATRKTREKNRRLGLGIMGVADWLISRGKPYGPDDELADWLTEYVKSTAIAAGYAKRLGVSPPVKTRAVAPNGTLGILGECQSSAEPPFAAATKRRWLDNGVWKWQYIIDSSTQRFVDMGVDPDTIDYAYDLDPERRVAFQAWLQQYVDHGISSTVNLPAVDQQNFTHEEFGTMLLKYLPDLRGITTYPDGARGGQPLTVVPYLEAFGNTGVTFDETSNEQGCVSGVCGI
jgi:ribonucleoside-diphosphate reductase alpha chain